MRDKRVFSDTQADLSALSVYLGPFYVPTPDRDRASAEVKALAESRAAELGRKADALQAMRRALLDLALRCHGDERPECPIISRLADKHAAPRDEA